MISRLGPLQCPLLVQVSDFWAPPAFSESFALNIKGEKETEEEKLRRPRARDLDLDARSSSAGGAPFEGPSSGAISGAEASGIGWSSSPSTRCRLAPGTNSLA